MIGDMMTQKLSAQPKGKFRQNFLGIIFFILSLASYATLLYHAAGVIKWFKGDNFWLLYIPTFGFLIAGILFFLCGFNKPKEK